MIWEYIGEFREQVSTNDMIFTTMGGAILGEALRNASIYVEKKTKLGWGSSILASILDPFRIINRYVDSKIGDDLNFNISFINPAQAIIKSAAKRTFNQ